MNLKSYINIEIVKNERNYVFSMPMGAPFGECYDAAFDALQKIAELAKQAADQAKKTDEVQPLQEN